MTPDAINDDLKALHVAYVRRADWRHSAGRLPATAKVTKMLAFLSCEVIDA